MLTDGCTENAKKTRRRREDMLDFPLAILPIDLSDRFVTNPLAYSSSLQK